MRLSPLLLLPALAACAHTRVAEVAPPPPAPVVVVEVTPPPPPVSAINAGLSAAGATWHMRAGLNVAALACRGAEGEAIVARYNALLLSRKAELAAADAALTAEYRAGGGDWRDRYDDAMTRLYNFFSAAPARERFCAAASAVLLEAEAPGALPEFAVRRLPDLDAPFAQPGAPPVTIAALSAPPRFVSVPVPPMRPHLSLDLSALPSD